MKYRTRTYYTEAQKAVMWERWRQGWTLHQIAHLFDRAHTSVRGVLAQTGGIRPRGRTRCSIALTLPEREEISRAMAEGESIRSIATQLGRAPRACHRSGSSGNDPRADPIR
jgi:Helix-turn-helix domain